MLDSKGNLNEAMINSISSTPVDNLQLQNNQMISNSDVNNSTEDCGNSNQQIKSQYRIICSQNLADQTSNSNLSQSLEIHGDSVNSNMASLLIGQDCFLDNEHLDIDAEIASNVNEINLHLDSSEAPVSKVEDVADEINLHLDNSEASVSKVEDVADEMNLHDKESHSNEVGAIANEINSQPYSGLFNAQGTGSHVLEKFKSLPTSTCFPPFSEDLIEPFQSQLQIDIGPDHSMHSWRPNINNSEPDCSFFLPQHLPNCSTSTDINVLNTIEEVDSQSSLEAYWEESIQNHYHSKPQVQLPVLTFNDGRDRSIDLQSQLRCQRVQVNILKYELERTRFEHHRLRDKISDFEKKLNESFISVHKIVLLKEENARLGTECQFLSNEVDYYSKEKAPLGEIDENFYRVQKQAKKVSPSRKSKATANTSAQHLSIQETDVTNTWNCPKCTFANHPEINSCEICQTQRMVHGRHCSSPNSACYCHSREGTLPIFS